MPHGRRKKNGGRKASGRVTLGSCSTETLCAAIHEITNELVAEMVRDIGIEVGRALRSGQLEALGLLDNQVPAAVQIHSNLDPEGSQDKDVFGQNISKDLPSSCEYATCSKCGKKLAAARFSDHLAKCMFGQGRVSSRTTKKEEHASSSSQS